MLLAHGDTISGAQWKIEGLANFPSFRQAVHVYTHKREFLKTTHAKIA